MITLQLPNDEQVLATVGKISIRHGQLDYCLKMVIKSILGLAITEAIDATDNQGSFELRKRIRKLAKQKFKEGEILVKLDALLTRAKRATEDRNQILHSLWAFELDGTPVIRNRDHSFQPIPNLTRLNELAEEIYTITTDLNNARLEGFLKEALS